MYHRRFQDKTSDGSGASLDDRIHATEKAPFRSGAIDSKFFLAKKGALLSTLSNELGYVFYDRRSNP